MSYLELALSVCIVMISSSLTLSCSDAAKDAIVAQTQTWADRISAEEAPSTPPAFILQHFGDHART